MSYVTSFERFAREEGMQQGEQHARLDIALDMVNAGMDENKIVEFTKIKLSELRKLMEESKKGSRDR